MRSALMYGAFLGALYLGFIAFLALAAEPAASQVVPTSQDCPKGTTVDTVTKVAGIKVKTCI